MLIKRTKRFGRIKPRWLARMYKIPLDAMERLVNGEEVDVEERQGRRLVNRRVAVKVDETIPEPAKETADDQQVPPKEEPPKEKAIEKRASGKKASGKKAPEKRSPKGEDYFTENYPRYTAPDKDKGTGRDKDKEEDL